MDRTLANALARPRFARRIALSFIVYLTTTAHSAADGLPLVATIRPQRDGPTAFFARHMKVDGRRIIVGAFEGAFVFSAPVSPGSAWSQEQFLPFASLGFAVDLHGDLAVVGDDGADSAAQQAGAASFWRRPNNNAEYVKQRVVWPADAAKFDQFGSGVALGDGVAFVGADNDSHHGKTSTGTVTMYRPALDGSGRYEESRKFAPLDLAPGGNFGDAMDLDGDVLVVGASGNGINNGAAYVYERNAGGSDAWAEVAKLEFPGLLYGENVAVSGHSLLVSRYTPGAIAGAGAVDVYDRQPDGAWTNVARLVEPDALPGGGFGARVALSGDLATVSALFGDERSDGIVYVYRRNQGGPNAWGLLATLTSPEPDVEDFFGSTLAIMGNRILVGSLGLFDPPYGGVYVYAVPEPVAGALLAAPVLCLALRSRVRRRYSRVSR